MPHSPLISANDLQQALSRADQDWLPIDCRFNLGNTGAGETAYGQGHLPGALYAHLDRDLSGPKTGHNGRHPLPSPEAFERTVQSWGIAPGTRVVAYDDAGGMFAARLWWLLRWAGFEQVQVLDGGWQAWQAAQGAVDTHAATRTPSVFQITPRTDWVVGATDVQALLGQVERQVLIDARAPDRFRGENETMDPVGGHIPGARNRFFQLNLQADGRFKPADQLKAEFEALLPTTPLDVVVHQCGSGVTACHNLLAMAQAGLPPTRLYAGSWSEWCADPSRPVER
ncbi:MAG: sulfurtransferase [Aquabacterium sp.]|nr:sulfurtransferase [Aquabacterium sp.]